MALLFSLKKLNRSGHIRDWKKLDLSKIKYKISRPSYTKYIKKIIQLGWAKPYKNGLLLIGQNEISKQYKSDYIRLIYLTDGVRLRAEIEKAAIMEYIRQQEKAIKTKRLHKGKTGSITSCYKSLGSVGNVVSCVLKDDTNISRKKMAKMIGFSSEVTAYKRQRRWNREGLINVLNRTVNSDEIEYKEKVKGVFINGAYYLRRLSNELTRRDKIFGKKEDWGRSEKDKPTWKGWSATEQFENHF